MATTNEKIQPGKYVELGYDLYTIDADGKETLVHQTDANDPERIIFGVTRGVIVPLEHAIDGLAAGDPFDVTAKADEAFGPVDPDQVVTLEKDLFLVDGKFDDENIKPGAPVPMMTADGYRITGIVEEVGPETVRMDFNHPLAGKDIRFRGKITLVRDATPDELQPAHCGCGSDGCGCGDNCDCSADSNCGSGCGCH